MPVYLYQCEQCGVRFERMQRMSEKPLADCPECGGQVYRVIQPVGVIFKGSGFYTTDNRQVSSPTLSPTKGIDKRKEESTSTGESKESSSVTDTTSKAGDD